MKIPDITILNKPTAEFFIYAAADAEYFRIHGHALINSVLENTPYAIHVHIVNPTDDQLAWCSSIDRLTISYERLNTKIFTQIAELWSRRTHFSNHRESQMADKGRTFGIRMMTDIIEKTYYACCRFVRLKDIKPPGSTCLSIDIDGLVRGEFSYKLGDNDIYLYQKKSGEHLAGAILCNPSAGRFLKEYGAILSEQIEMDNLYWFLDQIVLDKIVPAYPTGLLPMSYIDWEMSPSSAIWSAKGKRKDTMLFISEQKKYTR